MEFTPKIESPWRKHGCDGQKEHTCKGEKNDHLPQAAKTSEARLGPSA